MDMTGIKEAVTQLNAWQQQQERYQLLVPKLQALFRLVEEGPAEAARLEKQNGQLREENARLKQEHQRDTERATAARAQADAEEARLRAVKQEYEAFKAKFRTPAAV